MKTNKILGAVVGTAAAAGIGALAYKNIKAVDFGEIIIDGIPEKDENAVRIMSFNLRYRDDKGIHKVRNRSQLTKAIIEQYAPDSIGVQEATGRWIDILCGAIGEKYGCVSQTRDEQGYDSERNAVFYRKDKYNLASSGTIWLSETPDVPNTKSFGSNCHRIATWAVLENKVTGEKYTHLNTHLDHILEETRVAQAKVLLTKVKELQSQGKVVCTGDFNAEPDSDVYATMTAVTNHTQVVAENSDEGVTFHNYGKYNDGFTGPIDYIFAPKDSKVNTYKIIRNKAKGMYATDHFPIMADIVL